jgi:hypothetical protein
MKIKLFLAFIFAVNLNATNLSEILEAFQKSKKVDAIKQKTDSKIAQNELFITQEAPLLGLSASNTKEENDSGLEYSLGISQTLAHPLSYTSKQNATELRSKAIRQSFKYDVKVLKLEIASRYHMACVSKEMSDGADKLFNEQKTKFDKLKLSFKLGEISRKTLLFNKLDIKKLKQKVSYYKRDYLSSLSILQESIDKLYIKELSCDDLFEISGDIKLNDIQEHNEIKKISYQQNSAKSMYDVYDSTFKSLEYQLRYDNELSATRYTFGLSIPIDFLSGQNEKQKAQYLHENSSLLSQLDARSSEIKNSSNSSKLKVQTLYEEYTLLDEEILPLSIELKELAKSALNEGEGSVMEYLDATRSYAENMLEMLQIKRDYYYELFELYKKADLGENL